MYLATRRRPGFDTRHHHFLIFGSTEDKVLPTLRRHGSATLTFLKQAGALQIAKSLLASLPLSISALSDREA